MKLTANWLGCMSNGIKLPSISRPLSCSCPSNCGLCTSPPSRRLALIILPLFTAREDGVHHRQIEVANIDVTAQITAPLRVCYLHLSVKLSVVGQTNQPAQLGTVIVQVGGQIQRFKRHGERRIIHALRDLHVTSAQGDLPLWQPSLVVSQLTSALPVNTPLARVVSGINGFSIAVEAV